MSRGLCSAEQRAACPLQACAGADTHHLAFEANQYRTSVERRWRELPQNKVRLARCVHEAIHYSGYYPEKPSRDVMLSELQGADTARALSERARQLAIGQAVMQGEADYFGGDAA